MKPERCLRQSGWGKVRHKTVVEREAPSCWMISNSGMDPLKQVIGFLSNVKMNTDTSMLIVGWSLSPQNIISKQNKKKSLVSNYFWLAKMIQSGILRRHTDINTKPTIVKGTGMLKCVCVNMIHPPKHTSVVEVYLFFLKKFGLKWQLISFPYFTSNIRCFVAEFCSLAPFNNT